MPCYRINYKHSAMKPSYIGSAIKTAHSQEDAVKFLGKFDKKDRTVIDKRGCLLTIISINEI